MIENLDQNDTVFFKNFFREKRVLITGHTGFKGSWLAIWLKELGAEVLGYSLEPPSIPNNFEATDLKNRIIHVYGDIRDFSGIEKIFIEFQPELVFHLAAQPLVRRSFEEPQMTFETNVMGTTNMLELVRRSSSVRVFINITTDKCYENKEWVWGYRENDPLGGYDPYSTSKACSELITQAYIRSFFSNRESIGVASVRAGNVIGGGDWGTDRILPDCVRALSKREKILMRNPNSVRPWQFVLEPLYGYLLLATKLLERPKDFMGAWNFGPDDGSYIPVSEVVNKVIHYWGSGDWGNVQSPSEDKHEMHLLKLNCDKAYSFLKWRAILDIDSAIKMTIEWFKTFYQSPNIDMYNHCVTQIKEYTHILYNPTIK